MIVSCSSTSSKNFSSSILASKEILGRFRVILSRFPVLWVSSSRS